MALRLVASAVAAVLGVALLLSPELGSGGLMAAGSSAASDALPDDASSRADDGVGKVGTTPPATPSDRAAAAERATDLRALALPEADVLPTRTRVEDDNSDTDPDDVGGLVPLPGVGPPIDSLAPTPPSLPAAEEDDRREQDTDGPDGDDGATAAGDDDTADQDARADGTTSDDPEQNGGPAQSSKDGAADDGATEGSASGDDGSTGADQTDPESSDGSAGADGEDPSGGGLDLGDTGGEPLSLER
jgi:hypothetical protein